MQDPISKKWSTTAIVLEEREHGNSYVLTTEGTDKTFIRRQQLLKHHSIPIHSQVNKVDHGGPRMSHTQVRADEATTNHKENNYGLFSLSADTGMASGSNLLLWPA